MATVPEPITPMHAALGAAFRTTREAKRWSLAMLAKEMGMSINTIRWHEAGARMLRTDDIIKAAAILRVEPRELICMEPKEAEDGRAAA